MADAVRAFFCRCVVDNAVAVLARLFAEAGDNDYEPRAVGFLTRMAWLPALIRDLDT